MCCQLCRLQWSGAQERYSGLDKDKAKALADLAALRKQFDEREAQFRAQVVAAVIAPAVAACPECTHASAARLRACLSPWPWCHDMKR